MPNKTLHRTAIPLRSIAAGELLRSAHKKDQGRCARVVWQCDTSPIALGDKGYEYTSRIQHRVVEGSGAPAMDCGGCGVAQVAPPAREAQPCGYRGPRQRGADHAR